MPAHQRSPIVLPANVWLEELRDELMREGVAPRTADVVSRTVLNRLVERHHVGHGTSAEKAGELANVATFTS